MGRGSSGSSGSCEPRDRSPASPSLLPLAQVQALLEEMLEKLTDEFNMAELMAKVEERTPYAVVALQECERMNVLTAEIRRSLAELELGLKVGELQNPAECCSGSKRGHRGGFAAGCKASLAPQGSQVDF